MMSGNKGISAFPESDHLFKWVRTIRGAAGTLYEDMRSQLSLELPVATLPTHPWQSSYPCYHADADTPGNICLHIPKDLWSALYDIRTILLPVQGLLGEPNMDSLLNTHMAKNLTACKYLQETYAKQDSSPEP